MKRLARFGLSTGRDQVDVGNDPLIDLEVGFFV